MDMDMIYIYMDIFLIWIWYQDMIPYFPIMIYHIIYIPIMNYSQLSTGSHWFSTSLKLPKAVETRREVVEGDKKAVVGWD